MIEDYSFGHMRILDEEYSKDVKICGDRIVHPWWRASGHQVDVEDVRDIVEHEPEVLVLGKGSPGLMQATSGLREMLRSRGIELIELPTDEAVQRFNALRDEGRNVCAGFHLTC
jgi:hypothetical protein